MPNVSNRGTALPASPIRKLIPFSDAAKKRGTRVFHLNIGQPDLPTPQKALDSLKNIQQKTLSYTHSQGLLSLRQKLTGYYTKFGIDVTPDEIMITSGGSEALLFAFMTCLNPGDAIIMVEPGYANYLSLAQIAGLEVQTVTSRIEDGFTLPDVEEFEKAITPKTKAILVCNPSNPTGYLYSEDELLRIRDIVRKHDLFLLADEVYREFVYNGKPYRSAMTLEGIENNVVLIDSVSKRYSECGVRVGMLVSHNKEVLASVLKFAQSRLCPPLIGQLVAEASIEGTEDYAKACFEEYKARRDFFIDGLNKIEGVYSPMPQGAFYTVASLPVDDAEAFCKWCLTDFSYEGCTVMMAPAAGFYRDREMGKRQVRMAYVLCIEDLAMALKVLAAALKAYPGAC